VSLRDVEVNGARGLDGIRATLEHAPRTAWPTEDQMTLTAIAETWGVFYDTWFEGGMYRARRADGTALTPAPTPEGLDSAIRADWARRSAR